MKIKGLTMSKLSEKAKDLDSEGWFLLEEFGEEASEDAKKIFEESIKLGNDGAYLGLGSVSENLSKELSFEYLLKAAKIGRLDAVAAIINSLTEVDDSESLYMWCYIIENYGKYTFRMAATTEHVGENLSSEIISIATKKAKSFAQKVISDGHEFFDGY